MIKIYPVDVQIGNVENGISKLSNTMLQFWLSGYIAEYRTKGGIIVGTVTIDSGGILWHLQLFI